MAKGTVNKVIILGRLGKDPEIRQAGSTQIASLSVATNEIGKKDDFGNRETATEWHRCTLFGKLAENAGKFLKKGSSVYLEGRLETRKWLDKTTGQDRYSTDIIVNEMQFMGGKNDDSSPPSNNFKPQVDKTPPPQSGGGFDDFDDDIPF